MYLVKYKSFYKKEINTSILFRKTTISDHVFLLNTKSKERNNVLSELNIIDPSKENMILIPPITGDSTIYIPFDEELELSYYSARMLRNKDNIIIIKDDNIYLYKDNKNNIKFLDLFPLTNFTW